MIFDNAAIFYTAKRFVCHSEPSEKSPERNIKTSQTECEVPSPDKTPAFCLKGISTFFDRKMRSRRRPRFRPTQAACFRVSSSCTLYEVFGNFAWRSAPPRKRVTQSEKAPDCETESVPAQRGFPWIPCCIAIRGTETGETP